MEDFINTFHIDWKLMIAQIINFGLVFAVFYFFAAKPLSKLIKSRTDEIQMGLDNAKKADEMIKTAAKEYEENTIKLRKMSIDAQKELKKDLEKMKEENLERIKKDNDEWTKSRTKQMEIDRKNMLESVKGEIVTLAT